MGNFNFLLKHKEFEIFAKPAISAERICVLDPNSSITLCRTSMEGATNWLYGVEKKLSKLPQNKTLKDLISACEFRDLVGETLYKSLYRLRTNANKAVHQEKIFNQDCAIAVLNDLFYYLDWIEQTYTEGKKSTRCFKQAEVLKQGSLFEFSNNNENSNEKNISNLYDSDNTKVKPLSRKILSRKLNLNSTESKKLDNEASYSLNENSIIDINEENSADENQKIIESIKNENFDKLENYALIREQQQDLYIPARTDLTEAQTREYFIDPALEEAGWKVGSDNCCKEYPIEGLESNKTGKGYADYALLNDDGTVLAIVEAKKYDELIETGREQALEYAKVIEKKSGVKPLVFLSNGHEVRILNDIYPERTVSSFFSKDDLIYLNYRNSVKQELVGPYNIDNICGRPYQKEAIVATCEHLQKNYRKALIVMATGSGKTRLVLGLIKVLIQKKWIKNVLFLADRNELVSQACDAAKNILSKDIGCTTTNLCEEKDHTANLIFSTYQTMINYIDKARDKDNKRIYTVGHFDLIICDEAHRSIYSRYSEIFTYFDSILVGLTATPKDEIDKNTFKIFGAESGDPVFNYSLQQAIDDHFLVDFGILKISTNMIRDGVKYDELSEEEREMLDNAYDSDGTVELNFSGQDINKWLFNKDTNRKVLAELMTKAIYVDSGNKIGKTIIFARNHRHAEIIREVFYEEYPSSDYGQDFCVIIDNQVKNSRTRIKEFKQKDSNPRIVISVDMMDTGIDVPEILNLLFFKPVFSKTKFHQMIGRGTRCCKGLLDGVDKKNFLIIDVCNNFEFFKEKPEGIVMSGQTSLAHRTYVTRLKILQGLEKLKNKEYLEYTKTTKNELASKINKIPKQSFSSLSHLTYINKYSDVNNYQNFTDEEVAKVSDEFKNIIISETSDTKQDGIDAQRFDFLIYKITAIILNKEDNNILSNCFRKIRDYASSLQELQDSIEEIFKVRKVLKQVLEKDFLEKQDILFFERLRLELRGLGIYLQNSKSRIGNVDLSDELEIIGYVEHGHGELTQVASFEPYDRRVNKYLYEHKNDGVLAKIYNNVLIDDNDIEELEDILWNKIGTKTEYIENYKGKDLGLLVREIIGIDSEACSKCFSSFISEHNLNQRQISFIKFVISYVNKNGYISDATIESDDRFEKMFELFDDDLLNNFYSVITQIKDNASTHVCI